LPCPRCGDPLDVSRPIVVVAPKAKRGLFGLGRELTLRWERPDEENGPVRVVVTCDCSEPHPKDDKQDKASGCGTTFVVEIGR
jgi:hypothetical protein